MKQTSVWSPADLFPSPSTSSSVCWKLHPARHLMFLSSFFYYFILLRLNLFHVSPSFVEFTSFILREPPPPPPPPTFKLYSQFFCGFYSLHVLLNVHIVGHRGQCSLSKLPPLLLLLVSFCPTWLGFIQPVMPVLYSDPVLKLNCKNTLYTLLTFL